MLLLLSTVLLFASILLYFIRYKYTFWLRQNVPQLPAKLPYGNYTHPNHTDGTTIRTLYSTFRAKGHKHYAGIYFCLLPVFMPLDPDLIKTILTRDFQHFNTRGIYYCKRSDPISAHLFAVDGPEWRPLRHKLTATFTAGKMRLLFKLIEECTKKMLANPILDAAAKNRTPLDVKSFLRRLAFDVIGTCAFGLEFRTLDDPESAFRYYGEKFFVFNAWRQFVDAFTANYPQYGQFLGIRKIPTDVGRFFRTVINDTIQYRLENNVVRHDFIDLLMDLYRTGEITADEIGAQCFSFFLAGFETSSTTMSFALYELAQRDDLQTRLRHEISNADLTYDFITHQCPYLQMCIEETLRKYPPIPYLPRKLTSEKYQVPNTDLTLYRNQRVFIPVMGLHHDPEFYPQPDVWDPERFSETNKMGRHPYTYLPFGEGPRNCIGLRFGMMESKIGLAALMGQYEFSLHNSTEVPLKMARDTISLSSSNSIWLNVVKLCKSHI